MQSEISDTNSCVIADVQFLRKSALEIPRLLKSAGHDLPVIFVTAHDTPEMREKAIQLGAAGFFRKPVDDQALLDCTSWAIGGQR